MDENQKVIYDLLKEVREDQKKDSEKIQKTDACVHSMQSELSEVKEETKINTRHMGEHIARTEVAEQGLTLLRNLHQDNQKRIEMLEVDGKKKDEAIVKLQTKNKVNEKVKSFIKDNVKYWLMIASLTVGLVTKILGLW